MKHLLFPYIIFYVCIFLFYPFNLANFILTIAFVPYHSPNSSYILNCDVPVPKATVCYSLMKRDSAFRSIGSNNIYLTIRLRVRVFYEQIVNEAQPS